ncbi:MAG: IPT/TIG domain-containing protein [Bacteroidetes bacterium]|nr:IPT/TIG domain-containing protein [Bacteroidota bacterium]
MKTKYFESLIVIFTVFTVVACHKNAASPGGAPPVLPTPPTVTSVFPDTGAYNTIVSISGTNFNPNLVNDIVSFNGVSAIVDSASATQLKVVVPKGSGTGNIKISVGGLSTNGPVFHYVYTYVVSTLAGSGQGFMDGNGTSAKFYRPYGIAIDTAGNLVVADSYNNAIRKITPDGTVSTIAGTGVSGYQDGLAKNAQFSFPKGVRFDSNNNLIIADGYNNRIRKLTTINDSVTTIAGSGSSGIANGKASSASFVYPNNTAVDSAENIYVGDASSLLRKISNDSVYTLLNGQNTSPQFLEIFDLALDKNNNIILVDGGSKVYKITSAGLVSVVAGNAVFGFADGPAASASFSTTAGLAIDANGNILIADEGNFRIRKITPEGIVTTIAGNGTSGYVDGPASSAEFQDPVNIAIDKTGNIYVSEALYNRVRKISAY